MNVAAPNPTVLIKNFSQVQADLSRLDGNLTQWQSNGHIYPNASVEDSFSSIASQLDDTTLDLRTLHPEQKDLLASLKRDTLSVARSGGDVSSMAQHRQTFGSGWSTTLDKPINDVRSAIDAASTPAAPAEVVPPNPLKVMKDLSDVQADLSRMSGSLTQWQSNGHIYPNSSVADDFQGMASKLYDVRLALRDLHPEQGALLDSLKRDMLHVASDGGSVDNMAQHRITFGSGWSSTLNKPIADVRAAIELLAQ